MQRLLFCVMALVSMTLLNLWSAPAVLAESAAPASASSATSAAPAPDPAKLRNLTELLSDPGIQAWLRAQAQTPPQTSASVQNQTQGIIPAATASTARQLVAGWLDATQGFLHEFAVTVPTVPKELRTAWTILSFEFEERGLFSIVLLLAVFAALGYGVEWLFWRATTGFRRRMIATSLETVHDRLRSTWLRTVYGMGVLLAFALGSIGAFLVFRWPPLLRDIVLSYLLVFLAVRLTMILGRIILAPGAERFRMLPMATVTARFWYVWSAVLVSYYTSAKMTLELLTTLGVSKPANDVVALAMGVGLLSLSLYVVWRCPAMDGEKRTHGIGTWLLSLCLVAIWLLLLTGSYMPFHVGVVLVLLPIAIRGNRLVVSHILRPDQDATVAATPGLITVTLERGLRAILLIAGALLIASLLNLDLSMLTARDTMLTRLLRGVINAVVILLIADVAWHMLKALIDLKLGMANDNGHHGGEEARRRARLRTLLPILRNLLFITLAGITALMVLSSLGIEIGPLIAGAGVVGVAIGFGAQTLVKDIISGMFYLLDDAFRVGEYIQSGNYKGTVESFSIRSVKLRHHRGPLYTVPFGVLGAIQNMSRDWVIDKLMIGVTYDTDLDKVKQLIKQIGKELAADPELKPHIIETLKMQGVEQFSDYAIQIRMKMTTKPGEQFVIRRRAFSLIKKAFAANDIKFAYPMVQVAGGEPGQAAVAHKGLELTQPPAQAR